MTTSGAEVSPCGENESGYPLSDLTGRIIACAVAVHQVLGPGYLESIYEKAMLHEMTKRGLQCDSQRIVKVEYDGVVVGEHRADLVVENQVLLELKCVETLNERHVAQVISTLKATGLEVGLLMNFNETLITRGTRRIVRTQKKN